MIDYGLALWMYDRNNFINPMIHGTIPCPTHSGRLTPALWAKLQKVAMGYYNEQRERQYFLTKRQLLHIFCKKR